MCDEPQYKYIGYTSGFILSICLIPQIYKVIKTKKATDISYIWQILYFIGLLLNIVFCYLEKIWPILIPSILEITMCAILLLLKISYDTRTTIQNASDMINRL